MTDATLDLKALAADVALSLPRLERCKHMRVGVGFCNYCGQALILAALEQVARQAAADERADGERDMKLKAIRAIENIYIKPAQANEREAGWMDCHQGISLEQSLAAATRANEEEGDHD